MSFFSNHFQNKFFYCHESMSQSKPQNSIMLFFIVAQCDTYGKSGLSSVGVRYGAPNYGPAIHPNQVGLVQPVVIAPVGGPVAAVPLSVPHGGIHHPLGYNAANTPYNGLPQPGAIQPVPQHIAPGPVYNKTPLPPAPTYNNRPVQPLPPPPPPVQRPSVPYQAPINVQRPAVPYQSTATVQQPTVVQHIHHHYNGDSVKAPQVRSFVPEIIYQLFSGRERREN